jgi:ABC-type molybdenum transport system ATPase subunit/photorepair protein PhrA
MRRRLLVARGLIHRPRLVLLDEPTVAIMRAESLDGSAPEGVRRPANLEDAFVALTGEDIE